MRRACLLFPMVVVVALGAGASCSVDVNDDFGSGAVGATVGSGAFVPPCEGAPASVHAELEQNGALLRSDGADAEGNAENAPIRIAGVYNAAPGGFSVDACGVNPCAEADVYTVTLDLAGRTLAVPEGAYVELAYTTSPDGSFAVVLTNLADITDVDNPVDPSTHVWFELMHGLRAEAPFEATFTLKAACNGDVATFQGHDLVVSVAGSSELSITVPLGKTENWELDESALEGEWQIDNIASFSELETARAAMYVTWKGPIE